MPSPSRLLAPLLAVLLAVTGCRSDSPRPQTGPLRVAMSVDRPGMAVPTGSGFTGFDVDVAEYVARQLGRPGVTIVPAARSQNAMLLATDQVDVVISGYSMDSDQAAMVRFAGPYLVVRQKLMTRVASAMTLERVSGSRLCVAYGSSSQAYAIALLPGVHLVVVERYDDCLRQLLDRRVDGILSDDVVLAGYAAAPEYDSLVTIKSRPAGREEYAVGLRREDVALCRQVSTALAQMMRSGAWERSVATHLVPVDYFVDRKTNPPQQRSCH